MKQIADSQPQILLTHSIGSTSCVSHLLFSSLQAEYFRRRVIFTLCRSTTKLSIWSSSLKHIFGESLCEIQVMYSEYSSQEIYWEEHLQNDVFCVQQDARPELSHCNLPRNTIHNISQNIVECQPEIVHYDLVGFF